VLLFADVDVGGLASGRHWRACRVDLIIAPASQYYYALVGWTGSKYFNRSLRLYAQRRLGLHLSSHCLYDPKTVNFFFTLTLHHHHERKLEECNVDFIRFITGNIHTLILERRLDFLKINCVILPSFAIYFLYFNVAVLIFVLLPLLVNKDECYGA